MRFIKHRVTFDGRSRGPKEQGEVEKHQPQAPHGRPHSSMMKVRKSCLSTGGEEVARRSKPVHGETAPRCGWPLGPIQFDSPPPRRWHWVVRWQIQRSSPSVGPSAEARKGVWSDLSDAVQSSRGQHQHPDNPHHVSPWQSSNKEHGHTNGTEHGRGGKIRRQDQATHQGQCHQGWASRPSTSRPRHGHAPAVAWPPTARARVGEVRRLDGQPDERKFDPPSGVVDVRAKEEGEHQGRHGERKRTLANFPKYLKWMRCTPKHDDPAPVSKAICLNRNLALLPSAL